MRRSGIKTRYSVLPDFSCDKEDRTIHAKRCQKSAMAGGSGQDELL
jgi:hypothetical protein